MSGDSGTVTLNEAQYIFQVVYQLLSFITDLDLVREPAIKKDPELVGRSFGCQAERAVTIGVFGDSNDADARKELKVTIFQFKQNEDVKRFVQIFEHGKAEEDQNMASMSPKKLGEIAKSSDSRLKSPIGAAEKRSKA